LPFLLCKHGNGRNQRDADRYGKNKRTKRFH
jgi:hypothetical protein